MIINEYNRLKAVQYAREYALSRNTKYMDFSTEELGGDCTNFVSQCIFSGAPKMNYTKIFGWYYVNGNNRAPAWTGVEYLYRFLTTNIKEGPFASDCARSQLEIGDIIQLCFDGEKFSHTLIVTEIIGEQIFVSTHSFDSLNRSLDSYIFDKVRYIKIRGYR